MLEIWHIFNMAAVCHLGFLKVVNFNTRSGSEAHTQYASSCQILPVITAQTYLHISVKNCNALYGTFFLLIFLSH